MRKGKWTAEWRKIARCSCGKELGRHVRAPNRDDVSEKYERYMSKRTKSSDSRPTVVKGIATHTWGRSDRHVVDFPVEVHFTCRCGYRTGWMADGMDALDAVSQHDCDAHRRAVEVMRADQVR